MNAIVNVEFGGKLRLKCLLLFLLGLYLLHMVLDMVPRKEKKKKPLLWAEGNPSILSVLKFDSEVQDPGRQKANGGGGKKGREGLKRLFFFFTARRVNSPNTL